MAVSLVKIETWEWIYQDSTIMYVYWKMFDPDVPTRPSWWDTVWVVNETSNFNVSWFQKGNEVYACVLEIDCTSSANSVKITATLQQWDWSNRIDWWVTDLWYWDLSDQYYYSFRTRWWIDNDEIWEDYTQYRVKFHFSTWENFYKIFTVSWFDYDCEPKTAGMLWIDWINLCYTDWTNWWDTWYIHKIAPDSWYSWGNVWSDYAGHIWIPTSATDNHIYYIDEFWEKRRTNESRQRQQSYNRRVWSQYKWAIWTRKWMATTNEWVWYSYLIYVDWWWYVRRQGNWNVY